MSATKEPTMSTTILRQIGSDALWAVSARERMTIEGGIRFTYGPRSTGYRRIYITADGDLYTVRAAYMPSRGRNAYTETTTAEYHGVGAESLGWLVRTINQAV